MPHRRPSERAAVLAAALLSSAAVALLFWRIGTVPAVGFDEWWFLARAERLVEYGDPSDLAGFDLFAGNGEHSKLPPLGYPLRFALHFATRQGVELARLVSAAEMVVLAVLVGLLGRRMGAPLPVALLAPAFVLASPALFFFGRTVRYEQDTFFFGTLGLLLPALAPQRGARWVAGGALAGAAASMHPMGVTYALAFALAAALMWRVARAETRRAVLLFSAGAAVPVLLTAAYYALDWRNTLVYFEGTRTFHVLHHPFRLQALRAMLPLPEWIPDSLAAVANAVRYGLRAPGIVRPGAATVLQHAWTGLVLAAAAGAIGIAVRAAIDPARLRAGRAPWPIALGASALVAATVVTIAYAPNTDYSVYLAGAVVMGVYLAVAHASSVGPRWPAWACAAVAAAQIVVLAHGLGTAGPVRPSAEEEVAALRETGEALSVDAPASGIFYADTVSWAGAGRRLGPIHEYLVLEVAPLRPPRGIVFSAAWYDAFVREIAPFSGRTIDPERRRRLMEAAVSQLSFAGCLFVLDSADRLLDVKVWLTRERRSRPVVGWLRPGRPFRPAMADPAAKETAAARGRHALTFRPRLDPGLYVAMATGRGVSESRIAALASGTRTEGLLFRHFPHAVAGSLVWFEVRDGATVLEVTGQADGEGQVDVVVWRVAR